MTTAAISRLLQLPQGRSYPQSSGSSGWWQPSVNVRRISQLVLRQPQLLRQHSTQTRDNPARPYDYYPIVSATQHLRNIDRLGLAATFASSSSGSRGGSRSCSLSATSDLDTCNADGDNGSNGRYSSQWESSARESEKGYPPRPPPSPAAPMSSSPLEAAENHMAWPESLAADTGVTLTEALRLSSSWLRSHGVVDPEPSAAELLAKSSGFRSPQEMLRSRPATGAAELDLSAVQWETMRELCARRAAEHVPVQYLVGEWDFHRISLEMRSPTLIPRPETEELIEIVLNWLRSDRIGKVGDSSAGGGSAGRGLRFLDVGSGTGAIGLALLNELPGATCVAIDVQETAVQLSRRNAERIGLQDRYTCLHVGIGDFGPGVMPTSALSVGHETPGSVNKSTKGSTSKIKSNSNVSGINESKDDGGINNVGRKEYFPDTDDNEFYDFDFIVSNPPYIPRKDMLDLPLDVAEHEDSVALDGGEDGLDVVREIIKRSPRLLKKGGPRQLWMEVDTSHPEAMQAWLASGSGLGHRLEGGEQGEVEGAGGAELPLFSVKKHGVTGFEWRRDMSHRPRFVGVTFDDAA